MIPKHISDTFVMTLIWLISNIPLTMDDAVHQQFSFWKALG